MPRKRDPNKPPIRRNRRWSPDQNAWFVERWAVATEQEISEKFPGVTMDQMSSHADSLRARGVAVPNRSSAQLANRQQAWSAEQTRILIEIYPTAPHEELQRRTGKTLRQCSIKVRKLRQAGIEIPERQAHRGPNRSPDAKRKPQPPKEQRPPDTRTTCKANIALLNKRGTISTNTSGTTGVYFSNMLQRWVAKIRVQKQEYRIGQFLRKEDAVAARQLVNEAIGPILDNLAAETRRLEAAGDAATIPQMQAEKLEAIKQAILHVKQEIKSGGESKL